MAKKKRNKVDQAAAGDDVQKEGASAGEKASDGVTQGKFDFLGVRSKGYALSAVLILLCLGSLATRGLNWGIDFRGGSIYRYQFHDAKRATPETLRKILTSDYWRPVLGDVQIQRVDDSEQIEARSRSGGAGVGAGEYSGNGAEAPAPAPAAKTVEFLISMGFKERDAKDDPIPKLEEDLENKVGKVVRLHGQEIGPTIGNAIKRHALQALLIAVAGMLFYIALRFETKWGVAAVVAIGHDCLLVIGVFSICQLEVNSDSLAALLTIIGYSLNDTIVIMDRVRENLRIHSLKRKIGYQGVFNLSVNQSLARTLNTSVTTLFPVVCLLLFGGMVIRNFALSLFVGVLAGTYSSIYVVSSLLVDWYYRDHPSMKAKQQKSGS